MSLTTKIDSKNLEVLVTLINNPKGVDFHEFAGRGLKEAAEYLHKESYLSITLIRPKLTVAKSIGQNDPYQAYKLNENGLDLVKRILSYSNKTVYRNI